MTSRAIACVEFVLEIQNRQRRVKRSAPDHCRALHTTAPASSAAPRREARGCVVTFSALVTLISEPQIRTSAAGRAGGAKGVMTMRLIGGASIINFELKLSDARKADLWEYLISL